MINRRDRHVYGEDADIFRPERWIDATPEKISLMDRTSLTVCFDHFYFILFIYLCTAIMISYHATNASLSSQFGHGARTCVGKNISLLEVYKLVPQIVRCYEVNKGPYLTLPLNVPLREDFGLSLRL